VATSAIVLTSRGTRVLAEAMAEVIAMLLHLAGGVSSAGRGESGRGERPSTSS
jgi:hypothetical protein